MSGHTTAPAGPVPPADGDDERLARAALSRAVEPDAPDFPDVAAQVRRRGAAEVWNRLRGDHPDVDPRRDLELVEEAGGRLVCPGDAEWPAALSALRTPASADPAPGEPLALWVRGGGNLAELTASAVSVVGTRVPSDYGMHVAGELGYSLAERGWTVVSGAAFGIDAAAHRGALAAGGAAVAVLAGGADVAYPRAHAGLLEEIARRGAVLSEAPPGSPPNRRRFHTRHRLLAGLSRGTVLVESAYRSGVLETARHARRLRRPVMAVPGPVTSAVSAGCHRLLRDHRNTTVLVTCAREVLDALDELGEPRDEPRATAGGAHRAAATRLRSVLVASLAGRVRRTHPTAEAVRLDWVTDFGRLHPHLELADVYDADGDSLVVDDEGNDALVTDTRSVLDRLADVWPRDAGRTALGPPAPEVPDSD
jgi:DNA processing protein